MDDWYTRAIRLPARPARSRPGSPPCISMQFSYQIPSTPHRVVSLTLIAFLGASMYAAEDTYPARHQLQATRAARTRSLRHHLESPSRYLPAEVGTPRVKCRHDLLLSASPCVHREERYGWGWGHVRMLA